MEESHKGTIAAAGQSADREAQLLNRLMDVAGPSGVFGEPVTRGDYTVIPASEVAMGVGMGFGIGAGSAQGGRKVEQAAPAPGQPEGNAEGAGGVGMGGGGKGSRPVAAIIIGPEGVRIEPIVDPTKISIAFFTTMGAMFLMFSRMARRRQGGVEWRKR